jgi:hypothetical protein
MSSLLKRVTEEELNNIEHIMLFKNAAMNRAFAVFSNNMVTFGVAWQSDLMNPVMIEITPSIACIGIDQHFAIVDFSINSVCCNLQLDYNFHAMELFDNILLVATELEILKIELTTFSTVAIFPLPDVFESMCIHNDTLEVICMDQSCNTFSF